MPHSESIGIEIIGDLQDCSRELLGSLKAAKFKTFLTSLTQKYELTEVGYAEHDFDKGFTAVIALAESHVAVHTWPDEGYVSVSVHVCNYSRDNSKSAEGVFQGLCEYFGSNKVVATRVTRHMQ